MSVGSLGISHDKAIRVCKAVSSRGGQQFDLDTMTRYVVEDGEIVDIPELSQSNSPCIEGFVYWRHMLYSDTMNTDGTTFTSTDTLR